jgi:hypothetical protein
MADVAKADEIASSPWISTICEINAMMDVDGDVPAWLAR